MPPIRSSASRRYNKLITLILSISKVIPSYSYCIKKGLTYFISESPTQASRPPLKSTKFHNEIF